MQHCRPTCLTVLWLLQVAISYNLTQHSARLGSPPQPPSSLSPCTCAEAFALVAYETQLTEGMNDTTGCDARHQYADLSLHPRAIAAIPAPSDPIFSPPSFLNIIEMVCRQTVPSVGEGGGEVVASRSVDGNHGDAASPEGCDTDMHDKAAGSADFAKLHADIVAWHAQASPLSTSL